MPMMGLPVQSPVVQIGEKYILISPGSQITDEQYKALPKLTDIVAPNLFHHGGVRKAAIQNPQANLWQCKGLEAKANDIKWNKELSKENWPYQNELQMFVLDGMPNVNEVVFYHKPSKSLIVTDLCFNMLGLKGLGPKIILSLFGTYNKFAVSRLFTKEIKDKNAFKKSLFPIFACDFENIIVSHGENVIGNGKKLLREALKERGLEPI